MVKNVLDEPITKSDFVDFKVEIVQKIADVQVEMDEKFHRQDEKGRGYRYDILNALDKVAKELETWREDEVISDHALEDHEKRITLFGSRN